MSLFGFIKKRALDRIELGNTLGSTLVYRYPLGEDQIRIGAELVVPDTRTAVFVSDGKVADVLTGSGHTYQLDAASLPKLNEMQSWSGRSASFSADIFFVNMQPTPIQNWTCINPAKRHDDDFGDVSIWASGHFSFRVGNPGALMKSILDSNQIFENGYLYGLAKSLTINRIMDFIAQWDMPFASFRSNLKLLAEQANSEIRKALLGYGLEPAVFSVDSVTFSKNVEEALEQGLILEKKQKQKQKQQPKKPQKPRAKKKKENV
ncbi:MAG TPA: SPFH domain-containing protein [Bacilli bacterium]